MMKFTLLGYFLIAVMASALHGDDGKVYEVTATSLKVRADASTKSKVLYNMPRGSFVYDDAGYTSPEETIDGVKGRWIALYDGYVFSGFLKPVRKGLESFAADCTLGKGTITCVSGAAKKAFTFTTSTPLSGSWVRYDEETGCKMLSVPQVYEKSTKRLSEAVQHGDVWWIYDGAANGGGTILQFIVRVRGRGAC